MKRPFLVSNFVWILSQTVAAQGASLPSLEAEGGGFFGMSTASSHSSQETLYLTPKSEWSLETDNGTSWEFKASARAMSSSQNVTPFNAQSNLEVRSLSASFNRGIFKTVIGFQEVSWGETFGAQIADVVNPRDYRDPLLVNDLSWSRVPVFAINSQIFLDRLTLQGILTPVSRSDGKSVEFGGRASYLFESGLDLGVIYYHHENRSPLPFSLIAEVDTVGLTVSQTLGNFVLRADTVMNFGQPILNDDLVSYDTVNQFLNIVGSDVTFENDVTLGAQLQTQILDGDNWEWLGLLARAKLFKGKVEPEVFFFYGLNNPDVWIQPKLTWNMTRALTLSVRADLIMSGNTVSDGALFMVQNRSRVLSWLSFRF